MAASAARAVTQRGRDHERTLAADLHAGHTLAPACDYAAAAERIGRIEKAAAGPAKEAQAAAQAIEERSAEREIAAHGIKQKGEHGETIEAAALSAKRKGAQK